MANPPREACGVVGVYTPGEEAARTAFFGLFSLQHRGQESAGIASADGRTIFCRREMGLVSQAFHEFDLDRLPEGAWLVSNIPFGQRFARTPTPPLVDLIESHAFGGSRVALLMSREQAAEVSAATRLRARNVLVLGQPAAIAYRS